MQQRDGKRGRYNYNSDPPHSRPPTDFGQTQAYTKPHEFHGPLPESISEPLLLTDEQIRSFLLNGYLVLQPSTLPSSFHKYIIQRMKDLPNSDKLGNNCLPGVPALNQVYSDPTIKGALISLLGPNYGMHPHRAVHLSLPGKTSQQWHRDTFWGYPRPWMVMGMYYPQATTVQMGATGAKPGTQYYSIDPKRYNGPFTNHFKDDDDRSDTQFVCPEGSVAFIHYDLIHKGTANKSQIHRYMFKFQFYRTQVPSQPSWNCKEPKWNPFVEPSSRKKAIEPVCQAIWEWMCGSASSFTQPNISEVDVKSLIEQLSSPNEWSRFYAAFKLCLGGKHDIIFKQLLHTDEQLRFVAAHALALMPKPPTECINTLIEWIETKPNHTKLLCLYILGEWGKFTELLEKLNKFVALKDDQTIMYLVQTLGRLGNHVSEAAGVALGKIMIQHESDQVRMMASMALDLLATTQPDTLELVLGPLKQGLSNYNRYIQGMDAKTPQLIRTAYCLSALSKMKSVTAKEIALTHLMASRWCPITNTENTF